MTAVVTGWVGGDDPFKRAGSEQCGGEVIGVEFPSTGYGDFHDVGWEVMKVTAEGARCPLPAAHCPLPAAGRKLASLWIQSRQPEISRDLKSTLVGVLSHQRFGVSNSEGVKLSDANFRT
jgi:hypothetical protein